MTMSSDRAFEVLRADILRGRHRPGRRLGEVGLAPVRGPRRVGDGDGEALQLLDVVVGRRPRRRARRDALGVGAQHEDRVEVGGVVLDDPGPAVRRQLDEAVRRQQLQRLAVAVADAARPADGSEPDLDAVYDLNRQFHDLLLQLAGSASLTSVVGSLVHSTILMRTYRSFDDDAMHRSVEHHLELVAAVRARDPDWAECVMRSHLYSARAALLGARDTTTRRAAHRDPTQEETA